MEMQSLEFVQLVSCLALGITSDWMSLRGDLELWTFNFVETAIASVSFGNWTKYYFVL